MKIVVLAGGMSPERDVSLSSGTLIANALIQNGHEVCLLDLWAGSPTGQPEFRSTGRGEAYHFAIPRTVPDLAALRRQLGDRPVGPHVLEICRQAAVVFVALHGDIGENGQLQSLLSLEGLRFTGTGYTGCLLAMDKDISKQIMLAQGIKTAPWRLLDLAGGDWEAGLDGIELPCVVKPCSCGSSVGVALIRQRAELRSAIQAAARFEDKILVERLVEGREFSCGILGGQALPVIEIVPKAGWYDYTNKYQAGMAEEICPARLDETATRAIQQAAEAVHRSLRLGFYSRVDFILDAAGTPWCLEANTLPGMTPTSLLPQEAKAAGIAYGELVERIVNAALGAKA